MDLAVVIPAIDKNRYHEDGDLAPFGDTTLLEWKISQCKEFVDESMIYISSNCESIKDIANKENVNYIERGEDSDYSSIIFNSAKSISQSTILWTNPTSPFLGYLDYKMMIEEFAKLDVNDSLLSVREKKDFVFFDNNRLNFSTQLSSREKIKPIQIVTNGCYIINKSDLTKYKSLYGEKPFLYKLDTLSSIEIKDLDSYEISKELISSYFKRDLDV